MDIYLRNQLVNLTKNRLVAGDASLVPAGEDVLVVVLELLAADCADHVVGAGLGLLKTHSLFLVGEQLFLLLLDVFEILLI